MNSKPESQQQIADRLTVQLGFSVSRKQVRLWKTKGYPFDDIPALKHCIGNQERVGRGRSSVALSAGASAIQGPESNEGPEYPRLPEDDIHDSVAYQVLSDEVMAQATGMISKAKVIDFVRDLFECHEEISPAWLAGKTEDEIRAIAERSSRHHGNRLLEMLGFRFG